MTCAQWRLRSAWASTQSDQSSLPTWRNLGSVAPHWTHSEDSDQTGRIPRLICVFAVRISHFVCSGSFALFPCCPKSKSSFPIFPVPQNCLCVPVPLIFQTLVPCSLEINAFVPVFHKTPERAHQLGKAYSATCKELYEVWYDYLKVEEVKGPLQYTGMFSLYNFMLKLFR